MSFRGIAAACVLVVCWMGQSAGAQQRPGDLDALLHQMDEASARFKSAQADFRWDLYERVVKETTTQTGTIYFEREAKALEMGAVVVPPQAKTLEYRRGVLRMFDPGVDQITQMNAGANQAKYETFLTLGFGGSGSELAKAWTITDMGTEAMADGKSSVTTRKLDLVSKDKSVQDTFTHITIWVDAVRAISLKQIFYTPSGDMRTAIYSDIRYNQRVDKGKFAIKTDKKTTTVVR